MDFILLDKIFQIARQKIFYLLMDFVSVLIWHLSTPATCQKRAVTFARSMVPILEWSRGPRQPEAPTFEAQITNALITRFSRMHPGLDLDIIVDNEPLISKGLQTGKGLIIATIHSQLALAAHGVRDLNGRPPLFVGNPHKNMSGWNWGSLEPLHVLDARDGAILLNVRSALKAGRVVIAFVDFREKYRGPLYISPNLFALAHLHQIPVLHMLCTLDPHGSIKIDFGRDSCHLANHKEMAESFSKFIETRLGVRLAIRRRKGT